MKPALHRRIATLGLGAALVVGCASTPRPDDQLAASQASVKAANELGAKSIPSAALPLQLAEDELQHAKDLIKDGDNEKASRQLQRSKADGDLAMAYLKNARAVAAADSAQAQLKTLNPAQP